MSSTAMEVSRQELPPQRRSLTVELANQYGMEPNKFLETVKATVFPADKPVTNEQLAAFLIVANHYQLNPFVREIYAFPGRNGGIIPIVSIDGWLTIINRQKELDGIQFEDKFDREDKIISCKCTLTRKDRTRPIEITEYLAECRRDTEPWNKWPRRMLRHKALIQCARVAFGLGGVYDEDEGATAQTIDISHGVAASDLKPIESVQRKSETEAKAKEQPKAETREPGEEGSAQNAQLFDNGNGKRNGKVISEKQLKRLWAVAHECEWSEAQVRDLLGRHGIDSPTAVPMEAYDQIISEIQAAR